MVDERVLYEAGRGPERRGVVERRGAVRHAVDGEAEVLLLDGRMLFCGKILDLAEGGCYIETRARLNMKPGTRVSMVFYVRGRVFRLDAFSRAVRPGSGAGFLFEVLQEQMRDKLLELIAELAAEDSGSRVVAR
jgi:PilZ domain